MGKSHALASLVEQRNNKNLKSLLFLGQQFTATKSPEQQILDILNVKYSFLDILEGLNCPALCTTFSGETPQPIPIFIYW